MLGLRRPPGRPAIDAGRLAELLRWPGDPARRPKLEVAMSLVHSRLACVALFVAPLAAAQTAPSLPGKLSGAGMVSGSHRGTVNPVELSQIKQDGDQVTGIISNYRTTNGNCEANNTPFTGTYVNGSLKIKSSRLESRKFDGSNCGPLSIDATYDNGSLSGTYGVGQGTRINVEFPIK
jgi:hypothetical protein